MDTNMLIIICALAAIAGLVAAVCSVASLSRAKKTSDRLDALSEKQQELEASMARAQESTTSELQHTREFITSGLASEARQIDAASSAVAQLNGVVRDLQTNMVKELGDNRSQQEQRLGEVQEKVASSMKGVQDSVSQQLTGIRQDNSQSLEQIRQTVDEKLQSTLNERLTQSFHQVSEQLEQVYKGLGEMKGVANGVQDLRKVLSNVKTRGILGEIQLGAILQEMLSPSQYDENVATRPGSDDRVEFALRIPVSEGETIWLPIDSKFPGETYAHLHDAEDSGDPAEVESAWKLLETTIKNEARDIHTKYVSPPDTTNYGIMFLPFEGLYAEVANRPGLLEELQRRYRVNVAGPSTMAALLSTVQMSFQTFAIQRRANEIQKVLAAIKAEFPKYQDTLLKAQKQINTANKTLDTLVTTRTRAVEKVLKNVTSLDDGADADEILNVGASVELLPEGDDEDGEE